MIPRGQFSYMTSEEFNEDLSSLEPLGRLLIMMKRYDTVHDERPTIAIMQDRF